MAGMRDDDATNDVEFEVSRLDDAAPNAAPLYTDPTEDAPASGGAAQHGASRIAPENNLRPHRRLLQAGVTGLAVALAVAVILVSFPGIGERLGGPLHPFAPTPTVSPGSDIILLAHTVPWENSIWSIPTSIRCTWDIGSGIRRTAFRLADIRCSMWRRPSRQCNAR